MDTSTNGTSIYGQPTRRSPSVALDPSHAAAVPLPTGPGHNYSVVNVYGNGQAILGNVYGGLNPNFLNHATETDRKVLVLRSLYYDGMHSRATQISVQAGSPRSIDWVWGTSFAKWLRTQETFYWIIGQPGSGKSSLMKHLCKSEKTLSALRQSGNEWKLLHFYFDFRAEDRTANRIEGMLRTFLHQFIKQVPFAVEDVDHKMISALSQLTLHELLALLTDLLERSPAKICAFIDGLDEFRGSSSDLLDVIHVLGDRASPNMKICLASRTEPIFFGAIEQVPQSGCAPI